MKGHKEGFFAEECGKEWLRIDRGASRKEALSKKLGENEAFIAPSLGRS